MYNKKSPFEITTSILAIITEIAELVGQVNAMPGLTTNPMLRRNNRIRTIYSSLAIEQNTLSLEQVTAVLNGKLKILRVHENFIVGFAGDASIAEEFCEQLHNMGDLLNLQIIKEVLLCNYVGLEVSAIIIEKGSSPKLYLFDGETFTAVDECEIGIANGFDRCGHSISFYPYKRVSGHLQVCFLVFWDV